MRNVAEQVVYLQMRREEAQMFGQIEEITASGPVDTIQAGPGEGQALRSQAVAEEKARIEAEKVAAAQALAAEKAAAEAAEKAAAEKAAAEAAAE